MTASFNVSRRPGPSPATPHLTDWPESPPVSARRERARKIKPQYAEGELVRVARAQHQAEAELLQNLLLEEGIPSMTKRSGGFDVPDFLAAGPRDVLVPRSGAEAARNSFTFIRLVKAAHRQAGNEPSAAAELAAEAFTAASSSASTP